MTYRKNSIKQWFHIAIRKTYIIMYFYEFQVDFALKKIQNFSMVRFVPDSETNEESSWNIFEGHLLSSETSLAAKVKG